MLEAGDPFTVIGLPGSSSSPDPQIRTNTPPASTSDTTIIPASAATTNPPPTPSPHTSSLKIGIGVGVPLGVLLVSALAYIVYLSRNHSRTQRLLQYVTGQHDPPPNSNGKPSADYYNDQRYPAELPHRERLRPELQTCSEMPRVELAD